MKSSLRILVAAAALTAAIVPQVALAAGAQAARRAAPATAADRALVTARTEALDDWVTALTAEMNKATGQAKIDAMARVLNALVQHRAMMMEEMKMMQDDLDAQHEAMQRMMHRGTGAPAPAK